ncbi:MAG: carnitine dehydratase [Gammaproteobacteria bacterium]|nr:carnitine dehydratase [Gammaproteobacteria bacterium]
MPDESAARPLEGLRVLDLATFLAGPFCTTLMAEFGAEVIKVEQPGSGDPLRKFGTPTDCGDSLVWLQEARNKKCVTLNLKEPRGKALLERLVQESDVLVENFRTGTLEKWGLGWEHLHAINPRLIMLRVTGYGQTGPKARDPGFARIAHAFSGLTHLAGEADGPPLMPGSTTLADYLSGTYGIMGVLMALRSRDQTGVGQYIDIALYEPVFRFLDEMAPAYAFNGYVRNRMGADTVNVVPHSHYPSADGKWIAIACTSDKMFARLADAMDAPELASPERFGLIAKRLEERPEVNRIVAEWTSSLPQEELLAKLKAGEVPSGPIYDVADIFADAQYQAREDLIEMADERNNSITMPGVFPKLSRTPGSVQHLGRALGADNGEIFGELLGLGDGERKSLEDDGII